jgi:hypothetical protein
MLFASARERIAFRVALGTLLLWVVGCGPDNVGQVSGTVRLDGQPLEGAYVEFQPVAGNSPSRGVTDATGQYTLKYTREIEGAELGEHTVRITTYAGGDPDAEPPKPPVPEKVPRKYNAQSELKAKVEKGSNTADFELQSGG